MKEIQQGNLLILMYIYHKQCGIKQKKINEKAQTANFSLKCVLSYGFLLSKFLIYM